MRKIVLTLEVELIIIIKKKKKKEPIRNFSV